MRRGGERPRGPAVHGDDPVAGLQARGGGGCPALDLEDLYCRSVRGTAADGEDEKEDQERDGDVRERAGGDDGDPLPRCAAPVGLRRGAFFHLSEPSLGRASRAGRQLCHAHLALELEAGATRRFVVLRLESTPDGSDRRHEARLLTQCRLDEHAQVARGGPVHAGKLDHAAKRDHPDRVVDAVAPNLGEGRREADVEAPRAHPDRARHPEVPQLVHEDEQHEACDHDQVGHAAASAPSASARAARSASTRSSRSRTASVPAVVSVSPTTSGIPRNGSRPARNAATATSFAAL